MKLNELARKIKEIHFAGTCECGQRKFDINCGDNLAYPPLHESTIKRLRPELLKEIKYYDDYDNICSFGCL